MLCETVKETSWALSLSDVVSWCVAAQMCPVVLEAMSAWVPYGCNPQACSFYLLFSSEVMPARWSLSPAHPRVP